MEKSDPLDRELQSLRETITLSNPLTFGHSGDWYGFTLPQLFQLFVELMRRL